MIAPSYERQTDIPAAPVTVNLQIQLPQELKDTLMILLTQATLSGPPPVVESTTTTDFVEPESAVQQPPDPPTPEPSEPSSSPWTLCDIWDEFVEPRATAKQTSRSNHRAGPKHFDAWLASIRPNGQPSVSLTDGQSWKHPLDGDSDLLRKFAEHEIASKNRSETTVHRKLVHILRTCRAAIKAGKMTTLPERPTPKAMKRMRSADSTTRRRPAPKSVSLPDVARLIEATSVATWPTLGDVPPSAFWEGVIRWHAFWGPRTQDIFAYQDRNKTGLLWSDVFLTPECPDETVRQNTGVTSPHGWIYYTVQKDVQSDSPFILLPLPKWQAEFIRRFEGLDPDRVFPLARNRDKWRNNWNAIRSAAGVADTVYLSQGTGGKSAMRKTASQWWKKTTRDKEVAQYLLHHAEVTTADKHYLDTMSDVVPQLLEHVETPQIPTA